MRAWRAPPQSQAAVGGPEVASSEAGARLEALLGALGRAMAEAECLPEETAQLVQEKIALRGLVEEQMERIQELEAARARIRGLGGWACEGPPVDASPKYSGLGL